MSNALEASLVVGSARLRNGSFRRQIFAVGSVQEHLVAGRDASRTTAARIWLQPPTCPEITQSERMVAYSAAEGETVERYLISRVRPQGARSAGCGVALASHDKEGVAMRKLIASLVVGGMLLFGVAPVGAGWAEGPTCVGPQLSVLARANNNGFISEIAQAEGGVASFIHEFQLLPCSQLPS